MRGKDCEEDTICIRVQYLQQRPTLGPPVSQLAKPESPHNLTNHLTNHLTDHLTNNLTNTLTIYLTFKFSHLISQLTS
jgi:hypothetical protein